MESFTIGTLLRRPLFCNTCSLLRGIGHSVIEAAVVGGSEGGAEVEGPLGGAIAGDVADADTGGAAGGEGAWEEGEALHGTAAVFGEVGAFAEEEEGFAEAFGVGGEGLGETGLDYYYEHSPRAIQAESFRTHIRAAQATGIPLIIHTRDAEEDTLAILREERKHGAFTGVIHCFTGTEALARAALELGLYVSISGVVTFKKADALRAVVRDVVPLSRILVETDAPFLAPLPHRGERNEPAYTRLTAEKVAELKGVSLAEVARETTDNFFALFTKAKRPVG